MKYPLAVALLIAFAPLSFAGDGPAKRAPPKPAKDLPLKKAGSAANPCAVYGEGFVRMAGSDTCVKIGGAVSVGVGMR